MSEPIKCRARIEISPTATNEILFLPIGLHAITPVAGGIGRPIKVKVGPESAQAIEAQHKKLMAAGKRPYFDFNHEDGPASFWPESFTWRSGEGVIARGEWSGHGKSAVEGKDFRAFSPVFHVDNKRSEAATVVCKDNADPNMGGLVNNPAFKDLPLWCKNAGDGDKQQTKGKQKMETEEIDALRSKQQELQSEVDALKAQNKNADQSEIALENIQLKIEAAELRTRSALLSEQIQAKNRVEADAEIKKAIERNAILAKDYKTQETWRTQIIADPATFLPLIKSLQGNQLSTRLVSSGKVTITDEEPRKIYGEMSRVISRGRRCRKNEDKISASKEFAAIYAAEFRGSNAQRMLSFPFIELDEVAIEAADNTDGDLGTLSGTLVTQRTLELLKFEFPALGMFTTDFSDTSAQFEQTIMTRTVDIPTVVDYNTTTGWSDSTIGTNDIPVTIDKHKGVPITFNENILASTVRRLFEEQAPAQAYALAKQMMDDLYANITDANFPNHKIIATASFILNTVIDIGTDLDLLGVPSALGQRTMLLWPTVFSNLRKEAALNTALVQLAAFQKAELITNPTQGVSLVIPVDSFQVVKAPNLPTNNGNVTGFAGSKSALIIAARVPNDYTRLLPGASFGNVQMVTDPDLGLTVMLAQYVNHQLGTATSRISLMYGTAAGQSNAGELIKAATGSGSSRTS